MYPQMNKAEMPSAPPPYSEFAHAHNQNAGPKPSYPQYPPPPFGFQPGIQQPTQVIVVHAPGIPPLGSHSVQITCPSCKTFVSTSVDEDASTSAYLFCMLMFVVGCFVCSCLPFCMDNFKIYKHTCPRCNAFIGSYQPS